MTTMHSRFALQDDLHAEGILKTSDFCCPIFITGEFGTIIAKDEDLVAMSNAYPSIRSGTLTFLCHDDQIYGLTCWHVVKALEAENKSRKDKIRSYLRIPTQAGH